MTYELENGVSVGAVETFSNQHYIRPQKDPLISKLAVELEWQSPRSAPLKSGMSAPIVRGSPYTSMLYEDATPRIFSQRPLKEGFSIVVDQGVGNKKLVCGNGKGHYTFWPVRVNKEIKVVFETSDMTWLIFVSEPTDFVCSNFNPPEPISVPGTVLPITSYFDLKAVKPMKRGMIRVAMANNCTTGQNAQCKICVMSI